MMSVLPDPLTSFESSVVGRPFQESSSIGRSARGNGETRPRSMGRSTPRACQSLVPPEAARITATTTSFPQGIPARGRAPSTPEAAPWRGWAYGDVGVDEGLTLIGRCWDQVPERLVVRVAGGKAKFPWIFSPGGAARNTIL